MAGTDIRRSFLNTLDHFPCDLIRTLWTIQSLELQRANKSVASEDDQMTNLNLIAQTNYLIDLVDEQTEALKCHEEELVELLDIRRRYESHVKKHGMEMHPRIEKKPKLTVKISLKPQKKKEETSKIKKIEEPVYCTCKQVSYGPMVACDNEKCPQEWFHYGCIGITKAPVGKWYCSDKCRAADSPKQFKKKRSHR